MLPYGSAADAFVYTQMQGDYATDDGDSDHHNTARGIEESERERRGSSKRVFLRLKCVVVVDRR